MEAKLCKKCAYCEKENAQYVFDGFDICETCYNGAKVNCNICGGLILVKYNHNRDECDDCWYRIHCNHSFCGIICNKI